MPPTREEFPNLARKPYETTKISFDRAIHTIISRRHIEVDLQSKIRPGSGNSKNQSGVRKQDRNKKIKNSRRG
jgi:hypothetical protein